MLARRLSNLVTGSISIKSRTVSGSRPCPAGFRDESSERNLINLLGASERVLFIWKQFLGVWRIVQGTSTGDKSECITFNITRSDSNHFIMTQLPHNLSSELLSRDETNPSKMNIKINASADANFHVLITDYGTSEATCLF